MKSALLFLAVEGDHRADFIITFYRRLRMSLVRWSHGWRIVRSPGESQRDRLKPIKVIMRGRPSEVNLPHCGNAVDGAVSGLAHLEAPESLDEAVRLARASGIVGQIDTWGDMPSNDGVTIILDRCPHSPQRFNHARCTFDQCGKLIALEDKSSSFTL